MSSRCLRATTSTDSRAARSCRACSSSAAPIGSEVGGSKATTPASGTGLSRERPSAGAGVASSWVGGGGGTGGGAATPAPRALPLPSGTGVSEATSKLGEAGKNPGEDGAGSYSSWPLIWRTPRRNLLTWTFFMPKDGPRRSSSDTVPGSLSWSRVVRPAASNLSRNVPRFAADSTSVMIGRLPTCWACSLRTCCSARLLSIIDAK
mmetsp:Transcript_22994/g.66896  ORF Transcript_22994/g.66896 Transcript_22994/m.66896 type:complete len:206 (-) Transcript_22994:549-1166(-)